MFAHPVKTPKIYAQNTCKLTFLTSFVASKRELMQRQEKTEQTNKVEVLRRLKNEILQRQGFKPAVGETPDVGLGSIANAFLHATFPLGAIHEFVAAGAEEMVAASAFIAGLLQTLMRSSGPVLWVCQNNHLFTPALKHLGIAPERVIFTKLRKQKDTLWAVEEALKCGVLAAVIGEVPELDFTASRRLQLAVEHSKTTGFLLRRTTRALATTACVARWRITPLPSMAVDGLPGIGFPRWRAELLKVRNGQPGAWTVQWEGDQFQVEQPERKTISQPQVKIA